MPAIQLKGITKRFGRIVALEKVDLEVQDGEYVAILGPSGCGKTTLIKIIAGIWPPSEGLVLADGRDVTQIPMEDRGLGYVFQNIILFPHMNVADNAGYGPRAKGLPSSMIEEASREALELVGMLEQKVFFPTELSGGAQQKAALARALANRSSLLLLDEPLSALDARVRVDLRYSLRRLVKSLRLTAIHVTHDQEEAMSVADRVVLMRRGKIVEVGEPNRLYESPRELFTANFVGENNFLEGTVHNLENGEAAVELRDHHFLRLPTEDFGPGQPVVVAVRPEHLTLKHQLGDNCLEGTLEEARFMGSYVRHRFRLVTGDEVLVDLLSMDETIKKGDKASVFFQRDRLMAYHRPPEGLVEALKLD